MIVIEADIHVRSFSVPKSTVISKGPVSNKAIHIAKNASNWTYKVEVQTDCGLWSEKQNGYKRFKIT